MKIRSSYKLFAITFTLFLLVIGIVVLRALYIQKDLIRSENHRLQSLLLAIQLFQSSEDLTRLARSYVTTGNPVYEKRYFQVLDIRNGKAPRPVRYTPTYWHLAGIGKGPSIAMGKAVSLQELIRREGITAQEFALLRTSQANSDRLVNTEKKAFAALKGLYEDGLGGYTLRGRPDRNYAMTLLFGDAYFNEKAEIMAPIQQFMDILDKRTKAELDENDFRLRLFISLALACIVVALLGVMFIIILAFRRILRPIERFREQVAQIALGNYSARCDAISTDEMGELCRHFNSMAESLETDILKREEMEGKLRESEQRFRSLVETTSDWVWEIDQNHTYTYCSPKIWDLLGYRPDEMIGTKPFNYMPPEEADRIMAEFLDVAKDYKPLSALENINLHKDGRQVILETSGVPVFDRAGIFSGYRGIDRDITERKRAEEALKRSEARVRLLLDSTGEAIYGIDLRGDCTFANPSCARILGYPGPESLLGKNMHQLIHHSFPDGRPLPAEDCRIYKAFREGQGMHVDDEFLWRADGSGFPAEYWSYPQVDGDKIIGAVVAFNDITERKQSEEKIRHMATHDGLTDLPGLKLARDRLSMAMNAARRYNTAAAVMFMDLDGYKAVNDTYGHEAGDEVLREVAARLRSGMRETDTVARVGGDEFLLVVTEMQSPEFAAEIADKVVQLMSQPIILKGRQTSISASIGIALYPRDGDDVDGLIRLADGAMYRVKNSGKNGFAFAHTVS